MTTRIHVVNFGPNIVQVKEKSQSIPTFLYAHQYADFHVYDDNEVVVKEVKTDEKSS